MARRDEEGLPVTLKLHDLILGAIGGIGDHARGAAVCQQNIHVDVDRARVRLIITLDDQAVLLRRDGDVFRRVRRQRVLVQLRSLIPGERLGIGIAPGGHVLITDICAVGHGRRHIAAVIVEARVVVQRGGHAALVQTAAVQVDIVVEAERLLAPAIAGQNRPVARQMLDVNLAPAIVERTGQAVGVHIDVVAVIAQAEAILREDCVLCQCYGIFRLQQSPFYYPDDM